MTWEEQLFSLLDDLEQQAEALYDSERDVELADRSRAEYAQVTLASRLMASSRRRSAWRSAGVGMVHGELQRVAADWCLVRGSDQDWVVRTAVITPGARRLRALGPRGGVVTRGPARPRLGPAPDRRHPGPVRRAPGGRPPPRRRAHPGRRGLRRGRRHRRQAAAVPVRALRRCSRGTEPGFALRRLDVVRRDLAGRRAGAARDASAWVASGSSIASTMCRRTMVRGSRSRSSRSAYSGPSSVRSSSRAELANWRALRSMAPAWRASSGSLSGPNTSTATSAISAISGRPTPNMRVELCSGSARAACRRGRGRGRRAARRRPPAPRPPGRSGRPRRSACRRRRPRAARSPAGSGRARGTSYPNRSDRVAATRSPPPLPNTSSWCSGPQCGQAR